MSTCHQLLFLPSVEKGTMLLSLEMTLSWALKTRFS